MVGQVGEAYQMKRVAKLTARGVELLKEPGMHADGDGLYLNIKASGSKSWIFRFQVAGKRREMGLGAFPAVSLAAARNLAKEKKTLLVDGQDPIRERETAKAAKLTIPTFGEAADAFIAAQSPSWRNAKHRYQWAMTLSEYAAPLRAKLVNEIDTADVLAVLKPIWQEKAETATRLRGRIEAVLDAAKASGHRTGENPAAWRGNLKHLLPARSKLSRGHHAALPFGDVAEFLKTVRARAGVTAAAIEFIVLTAARSGEVLGMRWDELDMAAKVWTVPASRMKAGREHRVPLSSRAMAILSDMALHRSPDEQNGYVFLGLRAGRPMSDMTLTMTLRRMNVPSTIHGFRSSFRDWAGEVSTFPREVAEAALAHVLSDKTEAAYRRGDALEKRRIMMEAWAAFIEPRAGNVVAKARPLTSMEKIEDPTQSWENR